MLPISSPAPRTISQGAASAVHIGERVGVLCASCALCHGALRYGAEGGNLSAQILVLMLP